MKSYGKFLQRKSTNFEERARRKDWGRRHQEQLELLQKRTERIAKFETFTAGGSFELDCRVERLQAGTRDSIARTLGVSSAWTIGCRRATPAHSADMYLKNEVFDFVALLKNLQSY